MVRTRPDTRSAAVAVEEASSASAVLLEKLRIEHLHLVALLEALVDLQCSGP